MKLYLLGGLGADERVFKFLDFDCKTQVLKWIEPLEKESLSAYALRLLSQINQNEEFGLLGVSFGGIVAIEMAKLSKPNKVILISSTALDSQLPQFYLALGKTKMLNLIPNGLIKPPQFLLGYLFGAKNTKLLKEIIRDTDPAFIRWALNSIIHWSNNSNAIKPMRIHGDRDRLIPLKGNAIIVKNGAHFMIVDRAREINGLVNKLLTQE